MTEHKLTCSVTRDLLPAYIEGLTEPETTELVQEHLEGCAACQALEADMRAQIPVEKAPKRALRFLKRVKRTRLLAALLTVVVALGCIWWLYDQEFHYPNTEAGRLSAVEAYVPSPADSTMDAGVKAGTPLRVLGYAERNGYLYIAYAADNRDNVRGIVCLKRGVNGQYQPLNASEDPFPYVAGVMGETVSARGSEDRFFALMGDNCREIYSIRVKFKPPLGSSGFTGTYEKTYPVSESSFLWLLDWNELERDLGAPEGTSLTYNMWPEIDFLDQNGQDITGRFLDEEASQNWGSGKDTAETFLLYVYIGIVALLGVVFVLYFLRRD